MPGGDLAKVHRCVVDSTGVGEKNENGRNSVPGRFAVSPIQRPSWRPGQGVDFGSCHFFSIFSYFRLDHKFDLMYAKRAFVHW